MRNTVSPRADILCSSHAADADCLMARALDGAGLPESIRRLRLSSNQHQFLATFVRASEKQGGENQFFKGVFSQASTDAGGPK
jgi:hypothetical protein